MSKQDIRQQITDQVIEALEQGTLPWRCPWDTTQSVAIPVNPSTGNEYHGFNVLWLWLSPFTNGFGTGHWLTYRQAQAMGGQVRKQERGTPAVFYKAFEKETGEVDADGEPETEQVRVLRHFTVFNLDQIDGIEAPDPRPRFGIRPIEAAERILDASSVTILHGGTRACYRPAMDVIEMPDRDRFGAAADYYATALHELTHATKHPSRCDRPKYQTEVDRGAYAFEELVAEIGAMQSMAALGLDGEIANHASYIDHWLSILKEDKRAIFKAAAQAETAYQWLLDRLPAKPGELEAA